MTAGAAMQLLAASTLDVRAASYNIRIDTTESDAQNNWSSRKSDLVALVRDIAPEIIGFQEVKPSQYDYLKGQLSGYAFYGRYRDNGSNSEACPLAYLKSRFDFLDGGTFWLSSTPEVVGSKTWGSGVEDSGLPRICTWALLKDKQSGGFLCFACTHLDLKAGPRLAGNGCGGRGDAGFVHGVGDAADRFMAELQRLYMEGPFERDVGDERGADVQDGG